MDARTCLLAVVCFRNTGARPRDYHPYAAWVFVAMATARSVLKGVGLVVCLVLRFRPRVRRCETWKAIAHEQHFFFLFSENVEK